MRGRKRRPSAPITSSIRLSTNSRTASIAFWSPVGTRAGRRAAATPTATRRSITSHEKTTWCGSPKVWKTGGSSASIGRSSGGPGGAEPLGHQGDRQRDQREQEPDEAEPPGPGGQPEGEGEDAEAGGAGADPEGPAERPGGDRAPEGQPGGPPEPEEVSDADGAPDQRARRLGGAVGGPRDGRERPDQAGGQGTDAPHQLTIPRHPARHSTSRPPGRD